MPHTPRGRPNQRKLWRRLALGLALWAGLPVAAQVEQLQQQPPQGLQQDLSPDAKESLQSVTVNDAPEARKDIDTARDMERQHQWNKAAGWYQEVLEKYRTRVVAWKADEHNVINRYRGIVYQVQEALAKWPADGIAAYRARYEATAGALVEAARPEDSGALQAVLDTYFITEAAKSAGLKLIDLHMEAGEFDAAARVGELLLTWYPADHLIAERPRLLYRTALAHHLCGDEKMARQRADDLKQNFADAAGVVFGKDTLMAESLENLLKVAPALAESLSPDSWPMFAGSPDRAHVSPAQGRMGARIFSIDLPPRPPFKGQEAVALKAKWQADEAEGRTLGIMPVVDSDQLFFQDGARIWAVGIDSGIPLPGWVRTYGNRGFYQLKNASTLRNQQFTLTLTDSAVLGVMGQSNRFQALYADQGGATADSGTRLVCLDRESGKERWKVSLASLTADNLKDDEKERLRTLDLSGSPLVVGDNVYIIGRGGKDVQFENCYCLCFDLNTGQYRWSCLVGSANTNFNPYGGDPSQLNGSLSHLAYASGRLYLLTNLGALASIDAANGSIVWLSLYPRDTIINNDMGFMGRRGWRGGQQLPQGPTLRPWEMNPVLAQDGKLFFMPTDGKFLMVYDAATGEEKKRFNLDDFQLENVADHPHTLAGIAGEWILLAASEHIFGIKWAEYDLTKTLQTNCEAGTAWASFSLHTNAERVTGVAGSIRGRPFVTADSIYVATDRFLCRLSFKKGLLLTSRYPTKRPEWDEKEGPGNIVVTGEHVVIAGKNSIDVYTDMALAQSKLDREVAAAPDDAEPRLHYAEVMFAAGQVPLTLEKLNDAARLLGGVESMRPGSNRQRLFNDALTFAQKLAREQSIETIEPAIQFFDLAGHAADLASEQVNYRLSRAQFVRSNVEADSYATAVKLYQEILSRPELRTIGVVPEADARGIVQAAVEAEAQIGDLIRKHPEAYESVGKQAAAALETAKAAGDAGKLLEVAETYPNAPVAPKAMLLAADIYEQSKNPRLATHVLRQIYRKYGDTSDKDQIIEAMVRNYLTLPGGLDIAIARLEREKKFGDTKLTRPLLLPGGAKIENVTFRQTIEQLTAARPPEPAPIVPDVHVPFFPKMTEADRAAGKKPPKPFLPNPLSISDVSALVSPPSEMPDATRNDRVVAVMGNDLCLFAPGGEKPLGSTSALTDEPRSAVWTRPANGKSSLFVWSNNEIVALDGDTAALLWSSPLKSLPTSELITVAGMHNMEVVNDSVAPDPNADDNQQAFVNGRRQRFMGGRRNGFVVRNGVLWAQQQPGPDLDAAAAGPEQIWAVQPLSERLIFGTSTGRLVCLDASSGKLVWQTRVSPKPVERLVASEDFTAVKITEDGSAKLIVLDNYNGQILMVRNFGDPNVAPINMALSPDGMLVWTLPDRLCGKDLYEPDPRKLTFEDPPRNNAGALNPIYFGCNKGGQLVIRDRQIVALEQLGRFVSIHSLEDGKLTTTKSDNQEVKNPLATGAASPANGQPSDVTTSFRIVGPYMYTFGPRDLIGYKLDELSDKTWRTGAPDAVTFRSAVPTRDMLMMVNEPGGRRIVENTRIYQLRFYNRRTQGSPNSASGKLEMIHDIAEPAGITQWQAVDGGVYYVSGDHKLHFLRGSRE